MWLVVCIIDTNVVPYGSHMYRTVCLGYKFLSCTVFPSKFECRLSSLKVLRATVQCPHAHHVLETMLVWNVQSTPVTGRRTIKLSVMIQNALWAKCQKMTLASISVLTQSMALCWLLVSLYGYTISPQNSLCCAHRYT